MKRYSTILRSSELESHHQMPFNVTPSLRVVLLGYSKRILSPTVKASSVLSLWKIPMVIRIFNLVVLKLIFQVFYYDTCKFFLYRSILER